MVAVSVDWREKGSGVPEALEKLGVPLRYEELGAGVYIVGDIRVKRFSSEEFADLVLKAELVKVFDELRASGRPLIIVEGRSRLKGARMAEVLAKLALEGISVLRTIRAEETAYAIYAIYRRRARGGRRSYLPPSKLRRGDEVSESQLSVLTAVPGIGKSTARALLRRFKTLRGVFTASFGELEEVIGRVRAEKLAEVLDTIYPPALEEGSSGEPS